VDGAYNDFLAEEASLSDLSERMLAGVSAGQPTQRAFGRQKSGFSIDLFYFPAYNHFIVF
jgi:hypothetical protein